MVIDPKYFYWLYYAKKQHLRINVAFGLFIWLFLSFTLPFGMSNNNLTNYFELLLFILPFGLSWFVLSYLTDILLKYLKSSKINLYRNKGSYILILKLFLLAQVSFAYRAYLCGWSCVDIYEYIEMLFACTLLIGLIYLPFSLYAKNIYYQNMIGAETNSEQSKLFQLKGTNKRPISIALENIVYFKADDNYVDIAVFSEREYLKTIAFRATISSIEKQLVGQARFERVHRSFIINLNYLSGPDEKGKIKLAAGTNFFDIPVSKKYQKVLLELFH